MAIYQDLYKNLPDYYPTMYQDGYSLHQILEATHRTIIKRQKQRINEQPDPDDGFDVKIHSEVKLK